MNHSIYNRAAVIFAESLAQESESLEKRLKHLIMRERLSRLRL
jgi:hypothetical protein